MDNEMLAALTQMAAAVNKLNLTTKVVTGAPNFQATFGPSGLFSNPGLDSTIINASMTPRGIDGLIPAFPAVDTTPIFAYLTGFEPDGGEEPDGVCDDAPGGEIETCHQTAQFGRFTRRSKEMEANQLMLMINRGQTTDLQIMGSVLGSNPLLSQMNLATPADWFKYVVLTQMVIVGTLFQDLLCRKIWTGNPANNSAGGGYKEFPGLDMLISTGKVDAFTGVTCEALDSYIVPFAYQDVTGDTPDIVQVLSFVMYNLANNARGMGLEPVDWVLAMRPQLFFELTAIWPCRYLADRCSNWSNNGAALAVMNDATNVTMRDAMRNGRYLIVNGVQIPVVVDDGIFESNNVNDANVPAGSYASDIYILPLKAKGQPMLYWQFLNYAAISGLEMAVLNGKQQFWATDGGRYMWTIEQMKWCFAVQGKIEPRLILRTPQLAGRITDVLYTPFAHLREPWAGDPYWVKGGAPSFNNYPGTLFSDWNKPRG